MEQSLAQKNMDQGKRPAMQSMLESFKDQNERLYQCVATLTSLGHNFKDTRGPEKAPEPKVEGKGNGALYDLDTELTKFRLSNSKLEELVNKFGEII